MPSSPRGGMGGRVFGIGGMPGGSVLSGRTGVVRGGFTGLTGLAEGDGSRGLGIGGWRFGDGGRVYFFGGIGGGKSSMSSLVSDIVLLLLLLLLLLLILLMLLFVLLLLFLSSWRNRLR